MLEVLVNYLLLFLNHLETGRRWIYEYSSRWIEKREIISQFISEIEIKFKGYHPFTLIIGFFTLFFFARWILKKMRNIWKRIKIFKFLLKFGPVKRKIEKSREDIKKAVAESIKESQFKKLDFRSNGHDIRTLLNKISSMNNVDKERIGGVNTKITGSIYINDSEIESLVGEVVRMYGYSNLLHPDLFCSARFIEAQLIKIGVELFNGDKDKCCGITTSGGTESILFACIAYRNRGYKMGIKRPEIIVPITVHAAFFKAGEAFNIKIVKIPLDKNHQVDTRKVAKAINSNTVAIVGSCPNFPQGMHDNIEALSDIAVKYKVPLHVDACLGGLLVAFYGSANINFPKFDFRLPGVTSMSADLHKYGLCPKGISWLLYKDRDYRKHQYFIYPHFMGGIYPSPGFEGSRSPAFAVAAYAVMMYLGKNRYIAQAKAIYEAVKKVKKFINENFDDIYVIGDPQICSVAITGKKIQLIYDQMHKRGWHLNFINNPIGMSLVITSANIDNVDKFNQDLEESYNFVAENKDLKLSEQTKLYGVSLDLPEPLVRENLDIICDGMLD